ncbi:MAG: TIGR04211 family SH3 domain-containing protein [Desulfobacterales bacterium]
MTVRKTLSIILYAVVFITAVFVASLHAETRYVSDILVISVRDGEQQNAAVLGYIKTPTPVDVLEDKGDYLKIKTADGLEGWVLAKYLVSKKPNALIIEDMKKKIEQLTTDSGTNKKYEEKISELEQEIITNQKFAAKAKRDLIELDKKYKDLLSQSKNTEELVKETKRLKKLNTQLNADLTSLKKNNTSPVISKKLQSFAAGAGVFLIGFMFGGSAKKKKKFKLL